MKRWHVTILSDAKAGRSATLHQSSSCEADYARAYMLSCPTVQILVPTSITCDLEGNSWAARACGLQVEESAHLRAPGTLLHEAVCSLGEGLLTPIQEENCSRNCVSQHAQ